MFLTSFIYSALLNNDASYAELIKQGELELILSKFITWLISFGIKVLIAFLLFFFGRFLIRKIRNLTGKLINKRVYDIALRGFLQSIITTLLYIFLIVFIINMIGKQPVSVAALIGSAGLAIGLAVKDNLSNFAGGVMILLNKPFKGGDYIKARDMEGTVQTIGILYTRLKTYDNKTIYIPNGPLSTGNIINFNTTDGLRRVDLVINLEYGTEVERVKKILLKIVDEHPKTLQEPKPFVRMTKMNDSSIDFACRAWVKVPDYWEVMYDLNETIYNKMNEEGLNIPFPQMTLHFAQPLPQSK